MNDNIAILLRGNYLAVVAMHVNQEGGQVLSLVPPEEPQIAEFTNTDDTLQGFESSISVQEFEGWKLIHKGKPNKG